MKYTKGAFPKSVLEVVSNTLYIRKSFTLPKGRQKQIWRKCVPPTEERAGEVLKEIELQFAAETLAGNVKKDIEIAKIFIKVRDKEISFSEFINIVKIIT